MRNFVGLETFFESVKVNNRNDVLVAAIHWALVLAGFKCVGNEQTVTPASEKLPEGWNKQPELYTLKYVKISDPAIAYTLKIVRIENNLIVNALNYTQEKVTTVYINLDSHINEQIKDFGSYFKDADTLYDIIKFNLVQQLPPMDPPSSSSSKSSSKKEEKKSGQAEARTDEKPSAPRPPPPQPDHDHDDPLRVRNPRLDRDYYYPPSVGRSDLDPLGRFPGGGGMLMDPRLLYRPPYRPEGPRFGLPRGAVPPGARFDPFGPPGFNVPRPDRDRFAGPDRDRFAGPDPDHLPPPGYDDMFG